MPEVLLILWVLPLVALVVFVVWAVHDIQYKQWLKRRADGEQ